MRHFRLLLIHLKRVRARPCPGHTIGMKRGFIMKKRVGILTAGGDCPGLNATIRGVAKALYVRMGDNVEIIGILNGYHGLINGDYKKMQPDDFRGLLTLGGTILGTKRTPFKMMQVIGEDKVDKVAAMKKNYKEMKLQGA